jgi:fructan beta-fructosidase
MQILDVFVGDMLAHSPNLYLAHHKDEIDWWANLDLSEFVGQMATLRIRLPGRAAEAHMPADSKALEMMETSDEIRNLLPLYDEPMRPQFHFSQKRGQSGDSNGLLYYDEEYHFFWQSNPVGLVWENMYWGHAVSPDMIHWRERRPALRANGQGPDGKAVANRHPGMAVGHCHSGGGNVDHNNSGGFQTGEHKTLILTYTDTGEGRKRTFENFGESIAYSTDRGRTWKNYEGNPIIRHPVGRDPKLFWYEPGQHWSIGAYDEEDGKPGIAFYKSKDLRNWERTSKIKDFFECPEVFNQAVDGDENNRRWVMFGADAKYVVGRFDGKRFTPEHEGKHRLIHGPIYAGQCFSNPPDGRSVFMGMCSVRKEDAAPAPFCNGFTLPLNLTLHNTPNGLRLRGYPVKELNALHDGELFAVEDKVLTAEDGEIAFETDRKIADIHVTVRPAAGANAVKLRFSDGEVVYDVTEGALRGCGNDEAWNRQDGRVTLRVLIDRPMVEVFLNRGETYLLQRRKGQPLGKITLKTEGVVEEFKVLGMKSIWQPH